MASTDTEQRGSCLATISDGQLALSLHKFAYISFIYFSTVQSRPFTFDMSVDAAWYYRASPTSWHTLSGLFLAPRVHGSSGQQRLCVAPRVHGWELYSGFCIWTGGNGTPSKLNWHNRYFPPVSSPWNSVMLLDGLFLCLVFGYFAYLGKTEVSERNGSFRGTRKPQFKPLNAFLYSWMYYYKCISFTLMHFWPLLK